MIDKALADNRGATDPAQKKADAETVNKEFGTQCYNLWGSWDGLGAAARSERHGRRRVHQPRRLEAEPRNRRHVQPAFGLDQPERLTLEQDTTRLSDVS